MAHLPTAKNVKKGVVKPFKEFVIFPIVVGIMIILGVVFGFIGNRKLYLAWLVILAGLGIAGMYDFYNWLHIYGHHLNPKAILKILDPKTGLSMAYDPPFFGFKQLLNFKVYSYPSTSVYFIIAGTTLVFMAYIMRLKKQN